MQGLKIGFWREGIIATEFFQAKCWRMEEPILHRLRRRGGSGCRRALEGVVRGWKYFQTSFSWCGQVCDHLAGNLQPELRTLQEQSRRQGKLKKTWSLVNVFHPFLAGDLHNQRLQPHQLQPPLLFQVCWSSHCQGYLWQQTLGVLFHQVLS